MLDREAAVDSITEDIVNISLSLQDTTDTRCQTNLLALYILHTMLKEQAITLKVFELMILKTRKEPFTKIEVDELWIIEK